MGMFGVGAGFVICFILATIIPAAAQIQQGSTSNEPQRNSRALVVSALRFSHLMQYCLSADAAQRSLCRMYIMGAIDNQVADDTDRKRPPTLCLPAGTEWTVAVDAIIQRLDVIYRREPALHQIPAGVGVETTAKELFVCPRRTRVEFRPGDWDERAGLEKVQPPEANDPIFVAPDALLTNDDVVAARVRVEPDGTYVDIDFSEDGARIFRAWSSTNAGRPLAIFMDGEVVTAPIVLGRTNSNRFAVSGKNTPNFAKALADALSR